MVPFFVADRPMSLRMLKGLCLDSLHGSRIGIMAHANTTENFQRAYRKYPCDNLEFCDAVGGPCQHRTNLSNCGARKLILAQTVKMCDSGIFTREGATLTYDGLFSTYARMGVEYGIMIDVFRDTKATLKSGRQALKAYQPYRDSFVLVGVAQGTSVEEYLKCYAGLRRLGFTHIAVGGLLRRQANTVRYTIVNNEQVMFEVLQRLRDKYPDDWLFALGCLHPNRLEQLHALGVWADYKGWIFQYEVRDDMLTDALSELTSDQLAQMDSPELRAEFVQLRMLIDRRQKKIAKHYRLCQSLLEGKRQLRASLLSLRQGCENTHPDVARQIKSFETHALLTESEVRQLKTLMSALGISEDDLLRLMKGVIRNRELKQAAKAVLSEIAETNRDIWSELVLLKGRLALVPDYTRLQFEQILSILSASDQDLRVGQTREQIQQSILQPLGRLGHVSKR